MIHSVNPYNSEVLGEFEQTSLNDLDKMLSSARQGFNVWKIKDFNERGDFLRALASVLKAGKQEYSRLISQETGKVIKESEKEVEKSAMALEYFAGHGAEYLHDKQKKAGQGEGEIMFQPMGVILGIMPWNYPFWQFFRFAATTLMAGNSLLLKHSSQVPACSDKIREIFEKACFPEAVFQNLVIPSTMINNVIKDYRVQGVSLTGGIEAGSKVAEQAGRHIKKVVLELGGSDPFIVLEDADVKEAAKAGVKSRMKNFGQSCDAAKRFILHKDIAGKFLELFKEEMNSLSFGDPLDESSDYACLSSIKQKELLHDQLRRTLDKGGEVYWKGNKSPEEKGAFFNPHIITNISKDSAAYNEELFGPVASVFVVSDGLEAARIANDTVYGLGASIWTQDVERGWKMAREIQAGIIAINKEVSSRPELPFGGVKKSGLGREMSAEGSREFTEKKALWYKLDK